MFYTTHVIRMFIKNTFTSNYRSHVMATQPQLLRFLIIVSSFPPLPQFFTKLLRAKWLVYCSYERVKIPNIGKTIDCKSFLCNVDAEKSEGSTLISTIRCFPCESCFHKHDRPHQLLHRANKFFLPCRFFFFFLSSFFFSSSFSRRLLTRRCFALYTFSRY